MWYPMSVNPQTWINNSYFKSEGFVCVNIELRRMTTKVFPIKSMAYSECNRLNGNSKDRLPFEVKE